MYAEAERKRKGGLEGNWLRGWAAEGRGSATEGRVVEAFRHQSGKGHVWCQSEVGAMTRRTAGGCAACMTHRRVGGVLSMVVRLLVVEPDGFRSRTCAPRCRYLSVSLAGVVAAG